MMVSNAPTRVQSSLLLRPPLVHQDLGVPEVIASGSAVALLVVELPIVESIVNGSASVGHYLTLIVIPASSAPSIAW